MKGKSYAVIGLGRFGTAVALTLAESDCDVMVIDDQEDHIEEIAQHVTYAVRADVREPGILERLGVRNVDVAVVAIAGNMEASITAVMQAKELGVPIVIAKAVSDLHGRILKKLGADKVIYPEREMGLRTAKNLLSSGFLDIFELSSEFSLAEFPVPAEWVGKNLITLGIREKYNINIIGTKNGEEINVNMNPTEPLKEDYILIAVGRNRDLNSVR